MDRALDLGAQANFAGVREMEDLITGGVVGLIVGLVVGFITGRNVGHGDFWDGFTG